MSKNVIEVIKGRSFSTQSWSGGKSTQLYIYPPGSDYARRDFLFRLSTATVEVEESVFTSLPGFTRVLMVLEGELTISHTRHYQKGLRRFEQDEFDGGWETKAWGMVKDFNLILASQAKGSLHHRFLKEGEKFSPDFEAFAFIYVYEGALKITTDRELVAGEKDLLAVKRGAGLNLEAQKDSQLVIAEVELPD